MSDTSACSWNRGSKVSSNSLKFNPMIASWMLDVDRDS